ncbi:MAG: hypothetical protein KDN22_06450 [Verrucomicrobiae bacterium]|nr:hypothetical protein [Verrucomicrobiae bacterium]
MKKNLFILALLAGLATLPTAQAAITAVTPSGVQIAAPALALDGAVTNSNQQGFDEKQQVFLAAPLDTDAGVGAIPAGTYVSSHMIFFNQEVTKGNPVNSSSAVWTFDGVILGVMSDGPGALEAASTPILGSPTTTYPLGGFSERGLEAGTADAYAIPGGLGVGNSLRLNMTVTQPGDWIRVITQSTKPVPEGGQSLILLGCALTGLGMVRRVVRK